MISVRPLIPSDYAAWNTLYAAYAAFYQVEQSQHMRDAVWSWLHQPDHALHGLIAVDHQHMAVGLAHYRAFCRPLSATTGGFMDDLFVMPAARGHHIGQQLIDAVAQVGREKGWSVVRWITADNNDRARAVYDKVADQTAWVTYDIKL